MNCKLHLLDFQTEGMLLVKWKNILFAAQSGNNCWIDCIHELSFSTWSQFEMQSQLMEIFNIKPVFAHWTKFSDVNIKGLTRRY